MKLRKSKVSFDDSSYSYVILRKGPRPEYRGTDLNV